MYQLVVCLMKMMNTLEIVIFMVSLMKLIIYYILNPSINPNNPNIEGGGVPAGQSGPQRKILIDPRRNVPKFSCEKAESPNDQHDTFDDYLEIKVNDAVDTSILQIINTFNYSLFGTAKKWFSPR